MSRYAPALLLIAALATAPGLGARVGLQDALVDEAPRKKVAAAPAREGNGRSGKGGAKAAAPATTPPPLAPRSGKGGAKTTAPVPPPPPPPPRSGKGGAKAAAPAPQAPPAPRSGKGGQKAEVALPLSAEESGALLKEMRDRVREMRSAKGGDLAAAIAGWKKATARVIKLREFETAKVIRVNLNARTLDLRIAALKAGKKLLMVTGDLAGLRLVDPAKVKRSKYEEAATAAYIKKFGEELDVDAKVRVDLFVIASDAVNPSTGCRVGPPGASEELEYGMLRQMRVLRPRAPVLTMVEPTALVKGLALGDGPLCATVPADIVVTPSRVTVVGESSPKLQGLDFKRIGRYRIGTMRLLRRLRAKLQGKTPVEPKKATKSAGTPAAAARAGKGGRTAR